MNCVLKNVLPTTLRVNDMGKLILRVRVFLSVCKTGFLRKKLTMTDFLYVENEKIVRNSIRNDARSGKEKCSYFILLIGKI